MARKTRERSATRTGGGRSQTGTKTQPSKATQQHNGSVPLNPEKLKRIYSTMLKCRMIEEKVSELFQQGTVDGKYCAAIGREATEVGAAIDLVAEDYVALAEREFITSFIKGTPLKLIFARLRSQPANVNQKSSSPVGNGRPSLKIVSHPSSGDTYPDIAAGIALAYKTQKKPCVTLAFCGDGAASLDLWHQAMRLAGAQKLPIVFILENSAGTENSSGTESAGNSQRGMDKDLSARARAFGFAGITVDGNDVVAVFRVAQEAIRRAREGHGAALIECKTSRWSGQLDRDATHRSTLQAEDWKSKDPILFMENYLKRRDLWSDEWKQNMVHDFCKELGEADAVPEQSPHPEPVQRREQVHSFEILDGELNRKPLEFRRTASNPAKLGKP
jgi:TPP-dependent pyruvate/acetoin dehydrogenase alpha subunit